MRSVKLALSRHLFYISGLEEDDRRLSRWSVTLLGQRIPATFKSPSMTSLSRRLKREQPGRVSPHPSSCSSLNYFSRRRRREGENRGIGMERLLIVSSVFEDRGSSGDVCRA